MVDIRAGFEIYNFFHSGPGSVCCERKNSERKRLDLQLKNWIGRKALQAGGQRVEVEHQRS